MPRQTEYDPKVIEKVEDYLESCVDKKVEGMGLTVQLPSIEGLAVFLDVARSTLYKWAEDQPAFSDSLEKVLAEQAKRLQNSGLSGHYNSTITKLLMVQHGYRDAAEVNHKNNGGKFENAEITPAMLAAAKQYEEAMKKALLE